MPFAPLAFLRGAHPPRTVIKREPRCNLEDSLGRTFKLEFYHDSPPDSKEASSFFNRQCFPAHDEQRHGKTTTIFHPPGHFHLLSDEYFYITAGSGTWHLWGGQKVHVKKGEQIMVPRRSWHCFEGDASADDPLTIEVRYEAGYAAMEERFFRNTLGYMADCHKAGIGPSVFQLMVFFMHNLMPPGIVWVPGGKGKGMEMLNLVLNTVFMFVVGVVGEFLMGYRVSYPEYYEEKGKRE